MEENHSQACKSCQDSRELIMDLYDFHNHVHNVLEDRGAYKNEVSLIDDMSAWEHDINTFCLNLKDYRAHLVHKEDEAIFDATFYCDLKENEAIVVMDYKASTLFMHTV